MIEKNAPPAGQTIAATETTAPQPERRKIMIDEVEYDGENLSDAAKGALASLQFVEAKLMSLQNELAVCQTANFAYLKALKAALGRETTE